MHKLSNVWLYLPLSPKVDVTNKPLAKPKRRGKKQPGNAPQFDLRAHLYRISGVDFTHIPGFGALTGLILLSELGLDPSRFPTVKHFTSRLTVYLLVAVLLVVRSRVLKLAQLSIPPQMLSGWQLKPYAAVIRLIVLITAGSKLVWVLPRLSLLLPINWHVFFIVCGLQEMPTLTLGSMLTSNSIETGCSKTWRRRLRFLAWNSSLFPARRNVFLKR